MTNKLVVIINSRKVPKIKKISLYEVKFLVPIYSCLQNPWLGAMSPDARSLCPQLNLLNSPPQKKKIPGYATGAEKVNLSFWMPWRQLREWRCSSIHSYLTLALDEGELSHSCCGHFTPRGVTTVPTIKKALWDPVRSVYFRERVNPLCM